MIQPPQQHLLMGLDASVEHLLPLAEQVLSQGRPVVLVASCASAGSIPQLEAWYALKNSYLTQLTLLFTLRDEPQLYPVLEGAITSERLAELQPSVFDAVRLDKASIAGPADWIAKQVQALVGLGMVSERLEQLVDEAPTSTTAIASQGAAQAQAVQVRVTLQGRDIQFGMDLDGSTVLDAAEDAGLDLPYSCRGGVCSTCRTRVLQGTVDMLENTSLDDWELENGYVLACQAVPTSPELHISYDEV
jgi:ring-1,2-phenylacetyl-CoA epoxidase subunit PaaE